MRGGRAAAETEVGDGPDDGFVLAVHCHVVPHRRVVGKREIEHDLHGAVRHFSTEYVSQSRNVTRQKLRRAGSEGAAGLTMVQLTPITDDDDIKVEQSELPVQLAMGFA